MRDKQNPGKFVYSVSCGLRLILFIHLKSTVMKRVNLITICLLLIVSFAGSKVFAQSGSDIKSKITMADKEFAKNMLEGNFEKNLPMFASDAISLPSYAPMAEGTDAIRKAFEMDAQKGAKYNSFELTAQKIIPNGNQITEIGTYKLNVTVPGMDKPLDDHGKYLNIWEKQKDGSLKIKIETWNSDVDPMEMMKTTSQK